MQITINGNEYEIKEGQSVLDFLNEHKDVKQGMKYFALEIEGNFRDLTYIPSEGDDIELIDFDSDRGKDIYRHSASHILAMAVKRLFPKAKLGIGPAIEDGFYYDFDTDEPFSDEQLKSIEKEMKKIIKEDIPFEREELSRQEARELLKENNETYKIELLEDMEGPISVYKNNGFFDLCRGPHIPSTGYIKAVKLLHTAGAYWRGDEHNAMLSRIYGTAFSDKKSLKKYIHRIEEAKKRDHRKLGKTLDIYSIFEETGSGLVYWHPNGATLLEIIERFWKEEHTKRGYKLIRTPHIARSKLWEQSGHLSFYKDNMYLMDVDDEEYVVKPMNCPGHIMIYNTKIHSYRDLPVKFCELGTVYRYERSGTMHGLLRVRGFTQDDAHVFCTPEQLKDELGDVFDFAVFMIESFGYSDYSVELSMIDPDDTEKYAGTMEEWETAQNTLREILVEKDIEFREMPGEAVFYGPKIDIKLHDAIGNEWQGPTVQFDFNLPRRFNVTYVGEDNQEHMVYMVHRALLGSLERFVGGLIEHYAGKFPLWLAPVQARILTVTDETIDYSRKIANILRAEGIRVEEDYRNEKIGYKIRQSENDLVPYMLIIGNREKEQENISVRRKGEGDLGSMKTGELTGRLISEIESKK
ncbi:MAG: threonine--tRNA ligase [bacterium]